MVVKKITKGNITIKGKTFNYNESVEVSKEVGEYISTIFSSSFQITNKERTDNGKDDKRTSTDNDATVDRESGQSKQKRRRTTKK